jgi:hypothetical protein
MFDRLKRLFGTKAEKKDWEKNVSDEALAIRSAGSTTESWSDSYFQTMAQMQEAISKRELGSSSYPAC